MSALTVFYLSQSKVGLMSADKKAWERKSIIIAPILPTVNKETIKQIFVLDHMQQLMLREEISDVDIIEGFDAIDSDKVSEVDEKNSIFFKTAWSVIKKYNFC